MGWENRRKRYLILFPITNSPIKKGTESTIKPLSHSKRKN